MSLTRRAGWGSLRQRMNAATADLLGVQVTGEEERQPTMLLASWWKASPSPLEQAGQARVVLYQGTDPLVPFGALDDAMLDGAQYVRRVWVDLPVAYGVPLLLPFSTNEAGPVGEHGLDWWAVLCAPVTQDGSAIVSAVGTLTLWGFERTPSWRIR